ncbi:hypothetical protein LMIY3S_04843 [Labrys miyagiensis]
MSSFPLAVSSACIALLMTCANVANAYVYPGKKSCPWINPANKWVDYITQKFGDREPFFSIKFTKQIGTISPGGCYTVHYFGGNRWKAAGYNNVFKHNATEEEFRIANPENYELTVWGAMFRYNEAGEVTYIRTGELVGQMYCNIGSECDK